MSGVFHAPTAILFGGGSRSELPDQVRHLGASKVLIVTDPYLVRSGVVDEIAGRFSDEGIGVNVFSDVQPDPTVDNVEAGLAKLRESAAQAIVAVGGGSPIDAAKIIGAASVLDGPISSLQGYHRVPAAGPPLIAVPTTAGTGSEATKVAVITDTERQVKMMILDPKLMPRVAIVDFELTMTAPKSLTAHVGVDTLTHGLEAFVSRKATTLTDSLALSCMRLVATNLVGAWRDPQDRLAREGMSMAACQGGMAFTNSSVCLVHGMSRPIGALFHVPHGLSNAVLLPAVTRYSVSGAPQRYASAARAMGWAGESVSDEAACQALLTGLEKLNATLEIPRLRDCVGVNEVKFESVVGKMAEDALQSGSPQNNPVVPTAAEIVALYRQAW